MIKSLNVIAVENALLRAGLNQSNLAERLGVSRAAVSKWIKGESIPQPDKLLRIGMLLGLEFDQLVITPTPTAVPIVSYRRKAARKTKAIHLDQARKTGELLKRLVKYLPDAPLTQAPILKEPRRDYDYVQAVASNVRKDMNLAEQAVVNFTDLIALFGRLQAIIVPVLWGAQEQHGNALSIRLPDSGITWVFLNLDSNILDFKFWMAHELGHSLAPALEGEAGEVFADEFAQALLYPGAHAARMRTLMATCAGVGMRIRQVQAEAITHEISPFTIRCAIQAYENACGLTPLNLSAIGPFMASVKLFCKGYPTFAKRLFKSDHALPIEYAAAGRKSFDSPFFEALAAFCKEEEGGEHFIHRVLNLPLIDSKALAEALCQ